MALDFRHDEESLRTNYTCDQCVRAIQTDLMTAKLREYMEKEHVLTQPIQLSEVIQGDLKLIVKDLLRENERLKAVVKEAYIEGCIAGGALEQSFVDVDDMWQKSDSIREANNPIN